MIHGLIGKKVGMTHLFGSDSQVVPVTVLEVGPCVVTQVRTGQRDGYNAVQIGFGQAKQLNQPARGHLKPSGALVRVLREFPADDASVLTVGQTLSATVFQPGDIVDVTAKSKGRGFQGAVKRHGFGGGRKTHGQGDRYRAVGSIGAGTYPGRVTKGKRMPGHMGDEQVTMRNLIIERVDPLRNLIMVRGAVPGARNGVVTIRYAKGVEVAQRLTEEEWAELIGTPVVEPEPEVVEEQEAEVEAEGPVAEVEAEEPEGEAEAPEAEAETPEAEEPAMEEQSEEPAAEAEAESSDEGKAE